VSESEGEVDMGLVHVVSAVLFLLFLVLPCECLPVGDTGDEDLQEIDQALAMANSALGLLELDIVPPPHTTSEEEENGRRRRRDTVADNSKLWPGGVVPYSLPSFISESMQLNTVHTAEEPLGHLSHCVH